MLGRTDSRLRMVAILLVFAVLATASGLRLGYWQVVASEDLTAQILEVKARNKAQTQRTMRADIVDRNGVMMAKTSSFDQLVAYPDRIPVEERQGHVDLLVVLLDLNSRERADYMERLTQAQDDGTAWLSLEPKISLVESEKVRDAIEDRLLPGIDLEAQDVRHYPRKGGEPDTSLASHVLGFVRADGRGGEGVERYYDDTLTTVDPGLVDIASVTGAGVGLEGIDAEPLKLTIDAKLQRQVERELTTAFVANKAKSVSAIVMDPETGAILAAASVPAYDAEEYASIASDEPSRLRNRLFSDQYEPGSVMKIFTATAALDVGVVTPTTIIGDQRQLEFWKYTVRNADHKSEGNMPVKDVIARSRNVATAKIARRLAPNSTQKAAHRLYDLWEKVGMTGRTNTDISGEATGSWYDPEERLWSPVDLANRAFGQGVSVTLPQLALGISTIVNGGFLVQPHLAADGEGAQVKPDRVLKAKVARQARDILQHVTGSVPWYAKGSLIPGYEIGGKTGTAQIWDTKKGDWKGRRFNHSFIGFVGGKKQEYVIAVRLEEPKPLEIKQGSIPLGIESYELFQMVARSTIKQMGMKKARDTQAGLPILGSEASKRLTPERERQAKQIIRQEARREAKAQKAKAQKEAARQAEKSGRVTSGSAVTADPPALLAGAGT